MSQPLPVASTSKIPPIDATMDEDEEADVEAGTSAAVSGLPCLEDNNFSTSYTWHSTTGYVRDASEEGEEPAWILGIDEAGRGPVLGKSRPQVYGASWCPAVYSDSLKSIGFADSKALTDVQRARLMQEMLAGQAKKNKVEYGVTVMHPQDISAGMLQKTNYSLNAQSQDVTVKLIQEVINMGFPIQHIFVDPVGPHEVYEAKLKSIFPGRDITVVPKADALFPIVSAASIAAKVTRDTFMEVWKWSLNEQSKGFDTEFGSGYPSDPRTVAWLEKHFDPVFGYPSIARQSWGTIRQLIEKRGYKVKWCEDESLNSIRSYFISAKPGEDRERPALMKDLGLSSIAVI